MVTLFIFFTNFDIVVVEWERDAGSISGFFISVNIMLVFAAPWNIFGDNPKLP